jgi:hypothetical protein
MGRNGCIGRRIRRARELWYAPSSGALPGVRVGGSLSHAEGVVIRRRGGPDPRDFPPQDPHVTSGRPWRFQIRIVDKSRLWFESVRGDSRASPGYPLSLLISNHPDGVDGWDGCGRVVFALPISHRLPSFVLPQLRRATR